MIKIRQIIALGIALIFACEARSATFDLLSQGRDLSAPHSFTVEGITLSLSGGGTYNSTPSSFGIDSQFFFPDDPMLIDLNETLFFQFNQDVRIDSIDISQFDSEDAGEVLFKAAGVTLPLKNGTITFGSLRLGKGGSDRLYSSLAGPSGGTKGFSLDRIVVSAVPEPSSCLLFTISSVGLLTARWHRSIAGNASSRALLGRATVDTSRLRERMKVCETCRSLAINRIGEQCQTKKKPIVPDAKNAVVNWTGRKPRDATNNRK